MMYPRLKLARNLLREDGVIFVSIDDGEINNLRTLLNEVFGEENFVANFLWQKRYVSNATAKYVSDMHDHIICFSREINHLKLGLVERTEEQLKDYKNPDCDPRGPWRAQDLSASKPYQAGLFRITGPTGQLFSPPPGRYWRCNEATFREWIEDNRITFGREGTGRPMLKAFLSETQEGIRPNTWWDHKFAGHNKEATLEVKALFGGESPFDTPKPTKLIRRMLDLIEDKDALILDFFCGSGTTAHAVYQANHQDSGNRHFILIQLPEKTDRSDYPTIADITKARLRLATNEINATSSLFAGDLGFRVLKLDSSNILPWDPDREQLDQALLESVEHLKSDRSDEDVLFEVLLKLGLELTVPVEQRAIAGKTVYTIGAGALYVCLDRSIAVAEAEPVALGLVAWHKELAPAGESQVVFRDSAFINDVAKTNLTAILQQHGLTNVRSL